MSSESGQLKKQQKGKGTPYDPKLPKKLTIFVALKYPSWQDQYIEVVRESFDKLNLTLDQKKVMSKIPAAEKKRAMPFIQTLKKRLETEEVDAVFDRKLPFDEGETLEQILPTLKKTTGCAEIDIVLVDEGGKTGTKAGQRIEELPPMAEGAQPGNPRFSFENIG